MKILFIHPPVRVDAEPQDIPRGLGYLAKIAMNENHQVALLDLNISRPSWTDTAKQIAVEKWDMIALGGLSSMYNDIKKCLLISRKLNPKALIVCGGGFITYMADKIMKLNPQIDIACIGEGEEAFKDILKTADSNGDWSKVKGICYRDNEKLVYTEPRPLLANLDEIPFTAYELMDLEEYFKFSHAMWFNGAWKSERRINFVTERGCPRQCTFCTHNGMNRWDQLAMYGKEKVKMLDEENGFQSIMRFFSPRYVADEALFVHEKYGVDYIAMVDENLTANPKRVHELCDLWIAEGLSEKVKLGTSGDAPSITKDIVEHMKQAGFTWLSIGGESGSDKVLREDIGKGVTVAHNQQAVDTLQSMGIQPIMTFMVGNPNENIDDVLETVEFFKYNKIYCDPFICTPYPGTKIYMDNTDFILEQYDERLSLIKNSNYEIPNETLSKWKDDALEKFLLSLNNATDFSCTVSKHFDHGDLIALKHFMSLNDSAKILKLAHLKNWKHDKKWNSQCPICSAQNELDKLFTKKIITN